METLWLLLSRKRFPLICEYGSRQGYVQSTCGWWQGGNMYSSTQELPMYTGLLYIQFSSVAQSCLTLCDAHGLQHARLSCPLPTPGVYSNSCPWSLWCHWTISSSVIPFFPCPQSFPASGFFPMSRFLHIKWPKYWIFSFSISPSNEYSGLISFRMGWLDLLAVQGTLKSLLQHHSSKAPILWHSAFFMVQLSYPYMTTGKTIALTRWTLVGKVMSLLFNMLSKLVIAFLPRGKHLLNSWPQSPSTVSLGAPQNNVSHCFHVLITGCSCLQIFHNFSEYLIIIKSLDLYNM